MLVAAASHGRRRTECGLELGEFVRQYGLPGPACSRRESPRLAREGSPRGAGSDARPQRLRPRLATTERDARTDEGRATTTRYAPRS